jgi:prepilin-type N-terminal cleavage/methylation domain-containing protein
VRGTSSEQGFSLIELLVAATVFATAAALIFHFAARSLRLAASHPESADVHQRLRVAVAMMQRDLMNAGAGPLHGLAGRPLANYLPPIVPARTGARSPDPEASAFTDRISVTYVPEEGWSATLASNTAAMDDAIVVKAEAGCPGAGLCGFVPGTRAAILDVKEPGAGYDLFSVTDVAAGLAHGTPNPPFTRLYAADTSVVVPVVQHVYYHDASTDRLMLYDGYRGDVPLVDNVVALQFAYYADPSPAGVAAPTSGTGNCAYAAGDPPVPLLQPLPGLTLAPLTTQQMTDGPFCGAGPGRFDVDLLRIRRVRVTIRVQAGSGQARGSGPGFVNAGTASAIENAVKDFETTFDVAPRNLSTSR